MTESDMIGIGSGIFMVVVIFGSLIYMSRDILFEDDKDSSNLAQEK